MKVLGIDPGLAGTGFGCVEGRNGAFYSLYADTVVTPGHQSLAERLAALRAYTLEVLGAVKPAFVAVEQVFAHADHPGTVIQMAHARGVILEACAAAGVEVAEFAPRRVKQAVVGTGGASKEQVLRMVVRHLNLQTPPATEHEGDALALALCGHFADARRGGPA
jgi:crossover junction endodeoxyribonuclease RuvC